MCTLTVLSVILCTIYTGRLKHYNITVSNIIFQMVHVGTQNFLQGIQSSDHVLLENIFRIQLQDGYRKWHHSGLDWSARTRMGHKNVVTLRRNVLQLLELRQSRDLLVVILRLDIRAYCYNSS